MVSIRNVSLSLTHRLTLPSVTRYRYGGAPSLSNFNISLMQNRITFMERLSERMTAIEAVLKKLEPIENLLERVALLENNIYTTKRVFTFQEACMYIGVSESLLYKLTANKEIPHYKPRGKMLYFAKDELDEWLLQNYVSSG